MKKSIFYKKEYDKLLPYWLMLQDSYDGERTMKERDRILFESNGYNELENLHHFYLPPLAGMLTDEMTKRRYYTYLMYAMYGDAYSRSIDTYVNLLTTNKANLKAPEEFLKKASREYGDFLNVIRKVSKEVFIKNRVGVLIDAPETPQELEGQQITKQQSTEYELRPFLSIYTAEAITDWRDDSSYIVLYEETEVIEYTPEGFQTSKMVGQFRVLDIDESGFYRQRLVRIKKDSNGEETLELIFTINPMLNGKKLKKIPFYPITSSGISWDIEKSFSEPIANVAMALYRNSASYERAIMFTASPTVVVKGNLYQAPGSKSPPIKIGSSSVLRLMSDSDAKYLEYTGSGIKSILEAMQNKQALLSRLGADVVDPGKQGVESSETLTIKNKGEDSLLGSNSETLSAVFTTILQDLYGPENSVALNKDFNLSKMSPNEINALGMQVTNGNISWLTFFTQLQKGEIIPPTTTAEEEEKNIREDQSKRMEAYQTSNSYAADENFSV